jgi:hypothetical protein
MIDFRKPLEEYKNLTLSLIEKAKNDEELAELINKRDDILKEFKITDYSKDEFKEIVKKLNIIELDNELQLIVKKEMVKIKKKIENIKDAKLARNSYKNSREQVKLFVRRA